MKQTGYISLSELLRMLDMHRSTWHRRCQLGMGLVPIKKGNRNMYSVEEVNELLRRQHQERRM